MYEKKIITLDLTDCKCWGELYERIRVAFDFPEWFGANLSAFDDLLDTDCDADEIVIRGINTLPDDLREYMPKLIKILDKTVKNREHYSSMFSHIRPLSYRIES